MNNFFIKLLSLVLPMIISNIIYLKADKKYNVTEKLSSKLRIKKEWMAFSSIWLLLIIMIIIGALGIYVIDIPEILYFIFVGIGGGIVNGMNIPNKVNQKE
ncbi:hypothetical protein [Inconstantimicrobium mannanitabidum]|uniref:Uncharacterized protein n=1 Tax=Inconstantimicrobium mannanitabidum TaxID=1604901 RepID=A0ACB5R7K0_9CLOT|nr:hypothetical protein [Clostridium sp. TW13]GKX65016.1 hypothetical protein rsdtw13_02740 [Clostridium sp. TW13]